MRPAPRHRPELDGLRALAVLAVLVCHTPRSGGLYYAHTQLESLGAHGVDLFFVLSGFCLSLPYESSGLRSFGDAVRFLRRRLTRIAPTFYVALALFVALRFTPFGLPVYPVANVPWAAESSEILRDLIFCIPLYPMHDPPMWTLTFEVHWYVLFVVLYPLFYRSLAGFTLVAAACYAIAMFGSGLHLSDCYVLPTFMCGILAADLVKRRWKYERLWICLMPVAVAAAVYDHLRSTTVDYGSIDWAIACFTIVMAVTTNATLRRIFSLKPLVLTGVASYSIYLVHQPFLVSLVLAHLWPPLAAAIALAIGFAMYALVERPLTSRAARAAMDALLARAWSVMPFARVRPVKS